MLPLEQQNLNCSVFTLSCFLSPLKSLVKSAAHGDSQEAALRMSQTQRLCVLTFKDERQQHVICNVYVFEPVCPVGYWGLGFDLAYVLVISCNEKDKTTNRGYVHTTRR